VEDINTLGAVLPALLSALVLAALHLLAPRIRKLPFVPEQVTASFAGGIAVSYVFLHLLPELAEGNERVGELLAEDAGRTPLVGLEIFLVALVGFTLFYGLERLAERHHPRDPRWGGASTGAGAGSRPVFRLHLASFALYNAVIGYSLPLNWRVSPGFAVLFTIAIGLHFVLSDRGLEEHYGTWFDRWPPRLVLAAALLVGWGLAALVAPTSGLVVSLLTAFVAGSVLLNVFKEEIPSTRRSHFGWFVTGLATYALLLGLVTALAETEERGAEASGPPMGAGCCSPIWT
jgi:zinc transporter ZupT